MKRGLCYSRIKTRDKKILRWRNLIKSKRLSRKKKRKGEKMKVMHISLLIWMTSSPLVTS